MSSLVGACGDRKTTPGITGWYRVRVHIDPDACYLAVGFLQPGSAAGPKGGVVRPSKENMSWV